MKSTEIKIDCMKLTRPCVDCPFVRAEKHRDWLMKARVEEIAASLLKGESFPCHKTVNYGGEDEDGNPTSAWDKNTKLCAGSMIFLTKLGEPNQAMQVAERLGFWSPDVLEGSETVFDSVREMSLWHAPE